MLQFLATHTPLQQKINEACNILYNQIISLDVSTLPFQEFYRNYFIKCHLSRPVFSLQTSAKLLHDSIVASGKPVHDVVIMDYGAGLGTLYIIAKLIGVKKIIYNDLLPEFAEPAQVVDEVLGYKMDEYIIGDTEETCLQLAHKNIVCDIVVSRNVVEHIYKLQNFYELMYKYQPAALHYHSTTANWNNPAAHLQHILIHKKATPIIEQQKYNYILAQSSTLTNEQAKQLAKAAYQIGAQDLHDAIVYMEKNNSLPTFPKDYSNVCDENGTWCEHLLPYKKHKAAASNFDVTILPGFWDENYAGVLKKCLGKMLNIITKLLGKWGYVASSFIYIVARPKAK